VGTALLPAIVVGGTAGLLGGVLLLYVLSDEMRWQRFLEALTGWMDNRVSRWAFGNTLGRWVNLKSIESFTRSGRFDQVEALCIREGLIDESIGILAGEGHHREAAVLARRTGRDERASALFRGVIDAALQEGRFVLAAEAAELAGFWAEAVDLLTASESREDRLRGARIAGEHGMPAKAVEVYLRDEALMDAMRAAEAAGQTEFLFQYCEESASAVLHHFAADASRRVGDPERGLRILIAHGHMHQAAQFAREAGLKEKAREIREKIAEGKRNARREPPPESAHWKFRIKKGSDKEERRVPKPKRPGDGDPPDGKGVHVPVM
jgi:hypothetical protein